MELHEITEIFDDYEDGGDPTVLDEWLDQWLCERINDRDASYGLLPEPVRNVYAGRFVEWDVGNGGFSQVAFNAPHLLNDARRCYLAIGRSAAAERIATAIELIGQGHANFESKGIGDLFAEFAASKLAELDDNLEAVGWWAMQDRVKYASQHRHLFLAL